MNGLTSQINLKVIKAGSTSLDEIFGKTKKEALASEEHFDGQTSE